MFSLRFLTHSYGSLSRPSLSPLPPSPTIKYKNKKAKAFYRIAYARISHILYIRTCAAIFMCGSFSHNKSDLKHYTSLLDVVVYFIYGICFGILSRNSHKWWGSADLIRMRNENETKIKNRPPNTNCSRKIVAIVQWTVTTTDSAATAAFRGHDFPLCAHSEEKILIFNYLSDAWLSHFQIVWFVIFFSSPLSIRTHLLQLKYLFNMKSTLDSDLNFRHNKI